MPIVPSENVIGAERRDVGLVQPLNATHRIASARRMEEFDQTLRARDAHPRCPEIMFLLSVADSEPDGGVFAEVLLLPPRMRHSGDRFRAQRRPVVVGSAGDAGAAWHYLAGAAPCCVDVRGDCVALWRWG